jgi:hypothetical protein
MQSAGAQALAMTQSVEKMHRAVRSGRSPAFAELMDKVYDAMSPLDRAPLPLFLARSAR